MSRICQKCNKEVDSRKPDPCLGYLPGIAQACCGHENESMAYCVGWDDCKPGDSCCRDTGPEKTAYYHSDRLPGEQWDFYYEQWDKISLPPNNSEYRPPFPGAFMKRGKEAIEYMRRLKNE